MICRKCGKDKEISEYKPGNRQCRECCKARDRAAWHRKRKMVLDHYGGACACCGEDKYEFLAIDHIEGGGSKARRKMCSGGYIISHLRNEGFPEGYRVLCHNCNMAIGFYGRCPHGTVGRC